DRGVDRAHPQHRGGAVGRPGGARGARPTGPAPRRRSPLPARRRDAAPVVGEHPGHGRRRHHRGAEEHHRPARPRPPAERVVHLTLDDDQKLLAESARQLFERSYTTEAAREAEVAPDGFSVDLWKQAVELGWPGIALPEDVGGAGYGLLELA